jgi:phage-related minor tail protein
MEDVLPAEAQRQVNFEKIVGAQLRSLDIQIATTKATIAQAEKYGLTAAKVDELREALSNLEKARAGVTALGAAGPGAGPTDRERLQTEADRVRGELNTLTDPINAITIAAAGIGDAFGTSFKGIIDGSMTAKEALASFFTSVADMFLDMAAQIITKMITMAILNQVLGVLPGIGGAGGGAAALGSNPNVAAYSGGGIEGITMGIFGGARAKGGPVSSGQSYMVGERGPELFVPGRSGTIVPNDKMGGGVNVVVNVDAKGSNVEGNDQGASQLGRVISAAVQSELIKQQRPGGILAR